MRTAAISMTYIFHENTTFVATPVAVPQSRNESTGVDGYQRIGLLIGIDLNILIIETLELQCDPDTLHKRAGR